MEGGRARRRLRVFDRRTENGKEAEFIVPGGLDLNAFLQHLHQTFAIRSHESFVLATTDRTPLDFDKFKGLKDGTTLCLFQQQNQNLVKATEERITFTPHYDTLIRSGIYEYYASEGQKPLPYALAELIDNSLSATAKNAGMRKIEIRMMFDESLGKPAVIVLDNGCGMTSKQLNNWAVYRCSKFSRVNDTFEGKQEGYVRPDPVPRSLNSDISYFGVGGKQAVFFIGDSVRMITKPAGLPDVHELVVSKEDFERKEKNREDIYGGSIINRRPGDSSHIVKDDVRFLHSFIAEENRKASFTAVVITGVLPEHLAFLRDDFGVWTRQLANIYHYYIHGVNGKAMSSSSTNSGHLSKIDIQVTLREKPSRFPHVINLRTVEDDMQTLYINAAADTFEFNAHTVQDNGTVEGIIRYHPFLYDKETYPESPDAMQASPNDDDGDKDSEVLHQARGKRPIFDCFWNGRLIPYTTVSEFDWCSRSKGAKELAECYSRISGVLFTDDTFQVSTNKLTFMDMELKLKNRDTTFTRIVNGQKLRANIQKEFTQWLKNCHKKWDKQIKFLDYKETITRTDVLVKKMQHPWATFSSIEWDGNIYKTGQLVKSQKTQPILYGSVVRFLLYGTHDGNVFATGGEVEVALEPKAFHDKNKIISISKIDKTATDEAIKNHIDKDSARLPEILTVDWPQGNPWPQKASRPAGTVLGPLQIKILNKKEESISVMPAVGQGNRKKLSIELKVIQHGPGPKDDHDVIYAVAEHSAKWGFWFKAIDTLTALGRYTLTLRTVINESKATEFGGRELPSYKLNFTINEGKAESFIIGEVSPTLNVGVPFNIPLLMKDGHNHAATPPPDLEPVLQCSGLDLTYETVDISGTTLTIRGVTAKGKVLNYQQSKTYDLKVTLPGLKNNTQTIKISLLPGNAYSLVVTPEDNPITVENGRAVQFNVEIHDEAGNITALPKQIVRCQVQGFQQMSTDCSATGTGLLLTNPMNVKMINGKPQILKVKFEMPSQKKILFVVKELKVVPSSRVSRMALSNENLVLRDKEKIEWLAGGLLENLSFKLYDEAGRVVPPTDTIARSIKVNWTGNECVEDLAQGKLPDIHVPTNVPTQVQDAPFYQVSFQDQSVSVSFNIVPHPDEPTRLKATLPQITVALGEILPGNINLELVDQYDNGTKALTSTCNNLMTVEGEGLDKSAITFTWQESSSSVLVTGVQFRSGTPGYREMCFTYKSFEERVRVKVTAGVPAQLKLVGSLKPLQLLNEQGIATPFCVQLCDEWGNPTVDQRVVVELRSSPQTLKVTTAVISQPVNAEGKASFLVDRVSGPKGYYQLNFNGYLNQKPIPGPSVNLTVIPDLTKPVSLSVEYNANAQFCAGGVFPVFSVTVVSEEGSPITTFIPAAVSMLLWKGAPTGKNPPQTATELKCSKPLENEKNDRFHFRDKEIPEHAGKHTVQFSLRTDKTKVLLSTQITINVVANQPVKLGPDSQPPTPVVSYSEAITNRTLVENMTLRIMDSYGNPTGQDLNGKVFVSIKNSSGDCNKVRPLFENKTNCVQIYLAEGKAHITRLAITENSPGVDGSAYILLFSPEVLMVSTPLAPFELPFHFYNDAENQLKMSELSKKKDELTTAVAAYREIFKTSGELLDLLNSHHRIASCKEADLKQELRRRNVAVAETVPDIDRLLTQKKSQLQSIMDTPRRVFPTTDKFRGQQDVLGMVGHLAFVRDDDAAWVISWHIRGDMDCVVTITADAAQRIYRDTRGMQQVMPLDGVYVSQENRPLPHIRNGRPLFDPPGNPVLARDLLIYTQDQEYCNKTFKNILRDTILIDDLQSANSYRRAVTQRGMPCSTILTRQGERVTASGKFGGAQSKAPPMERLPVFGAPLPQEHYTLVEHIDLLSQHRTALQKRALTESGRDDHLQKMKSPEMQRKRQEMEEKQKQLEDIKRLLVSTPERPVKRSLEDAAEPSCSITKRTRMRPT